MDDTAETIPAQIYGSPDPDADAATALPAAGAPATAFDVAGARCSSPRRLCETLSLKIASSATAIPRSSQ